MRELRHDANAGAGKAFVRVLHVDGRDWQVREEPNHFCDRLDEFSLIFESPSLIRRVRSYPADWSTLADDVLFQLSLGT
jgi:hypothetical protein